MYNVLYMYCSVMHYVNAVRQYKVFLLNLGTKLGKAGITSEENFDSENVA